MGRGATNTPLAGWAGLLAGAPARRRREGAQSAASVLVVPGRDPDPRSGDTRSTPLRAPIDAQYGSASALQTAAAADEVVHAAGRRPARGPDTGTRSGDR